MANSYNKEEKIFLTDLGNRIRKERKKLNRSQEKLSFECELDRTYVGSVERGERNISILNLRKIASALGVNSSQLLNSSNE